MFCFTGMSEHCLSVASLRAWVKQLQIISERSSGREFLCNFLVGTRKLNIMKIILNYLSTPLRNIYELIIPIERVNAKELSRLKVVKDNKTKDAEVVKQAKNIAF